MPQGDKSSYTDRQNRQAAHIEAGYEKKGFSTKTAAARAWATINKLTGLRRAEALPPTPAPGYGPAKAGGGKKSGSGRRRK